MRAFVGRWWRPIVGWVVYPATMVLVLFAIVRNDMGWPAIPLLTAPSLLAGAVVRRRWMWLVPLVGFGIWGVVGLAEYQPCQDCEDDYSGLFYFLLIVVAAGSVAAVGIGHAIATLWVRRRRTPRRSGAFTSG